MKPQFSFMVDHSEWGKSLTHFTQGREHWNQWRSQHLAESADLSHIDLLAPEPYMFFDWSELKPPGPTPVKVEDWDFRSTRFNGSTFRHGELINSDFREANLDSVVFQDCRFTTCKFHLAKLEDARFERCELTECEFDGASLAGIKFSGLIFIDCRFNKARLRYRASWGDQHWIEANFSTGRFIRCSLQDIDGSHLNFEAAVLDQVDLSRSQFTGSNFQKVNMSNCIVEDAQFTGADLRGTTLPKKFKNVVFTEANLTGVQLPKQLAGMQLGRAVFGPADLSGADLSGANLDGVRFREAKLQETILNRATLIGADLAGIDLTTCSLVDADLKGANLENAKLPQGIKGKQLEGTVLRGADLSHAVLSGANLTATNLQGAILPQSLDNLKLQKAVLTGTRLAGANLRGTDLSSADLSGSDLRGADLKGADLRGTDLTGADLRDVKGLRLNSTLIRNAHFSPRSQDRWSTLRRNYTGTRFVFHLMLLVLFIFPYAMEAAVWVNLANVQTAIAGASEDLRALSQELRSQGHTKAADLLTEISNTQPCLSRNCKQWRVWELLLGLHKVGLPEQIPTVLIGFVLILYNVCRGALTFFVGPLVEEEMRSGYSPAFNGFNGYGWLAFPHYLVSTLMYLVILYFMYHLILWFSMPIALPAN